MPLTDQAPVSAEGAEQLLPCLSWVRALAICRERLVFSVAVIKAAGGEHAVETIDEFIGFVAYLCIAWLTAFTLCVMLSPLI